MSDNEELKILPGHSAPAAIITASDRSGYIIIANALGLIVVLVAFGLRIHMRIRNRFGSDDVALAVSTVGIAQRLTSVDRRDVLSLNVR